jgi:hypothetical protein
MKNKRSNTTIIEIISISNVIKVYSVFYEKQELLTLLGHIGFTPVLFLFFSYWWFCVYF